VNSLPALLGGPPVRPQGPPDWPPPDDAVLQALRDAHADGSWGKYAGGRVERLERRLAEMHGVEFALTCGSGTFAVELALRALKVGEGDEVVLAAYDYPGNFLSVHAVGALPVLVDVASHNWNLAVEHLAAAFTPATRAVIVSHLHGGLVPMRRVMEIAGAAGVGVIEDAAQAVGAIVGGRPAGSWGDVGVLSFGGSKLLTAGRGGAILTRRADVHQRARVALHRGNVVCPLSELQAAVLQPQLDQLPTRHKHRLRNVRLLADLLKHVAGLRLFQNQTEEAEPAYYKAGFQFDAEAFGLPRQWFVAAMRAEGVAVDEGFRALHVGRSPARLRRAGPLAEGERAHAGAVVLHHPILLGTSEDMEQITAAVEKVRAHAEDLARL
jgi:dTDP-4-amino-4,6-dideoxygalactose transaminase